MTQRPPLSRRSFLAASTAGAAALSLPGLARAAAYPDHSIDWILMWKTGGGADTATRIFTTQLEKLIGQKVVIQNITGGGGSIGYAQAKAAKADGYNLVTLQGDLPKYVPMGQAPLDIDDYTAVCGFAYQAPVLIVRADAKWTSLEDFIDAAKAAPGTLTVGVSDIGGVFHQPLVLLQKEAGFETKAIAFEGSPQQTVALLGGHVDAIVSWVKPAIPYQKNGQIKFLGYWAEARDDQFSDIPTLKEQGYDQTFLQPYGVGGPKGLPDEVVATLADATQKIWDIPEYKEGMANVGLSILKMNGAELNAYLKQMQANTAEAIKLIQG